MRQAQTYFTLQQIAETLVIRSMRMWCYESIYDMNDAMAMCCEAKRNEQRAINEQRRGRRPSYINQPSWHESEDL